MQSAAEHDAAEDPSAVEAIAIINSWFAESRMAADVERLGRPGAVQALCKTYPALRDWRESPNGGFMNWELMSEGHEGVRVLPDRGDWAAETGLS